MFKWVKKTFKDAVKTVKKAQSGHWLKGVVTAPKDTFLRKITGKYWFDEIALAVTGQWAGLGGDVVANLISDEMAKARQKKEDITQDELQQRVEERLLYANDQLSLETNNQLLSKVSSESGFALQKIVVIGGIALLIMFLFKKK